MGSLTDILRYTTLAFLGALALIVVYQLLTGRISARRLLSTKGRPGLPGAGGAAGGISPSRVQLLVISIGVAVYLLAEALRDPSRFPQIPTGLLLLMAGSQVFYLSRKSVNLLNRRNFPSR